MHSIVWTNAKEFSVWVDALKGDSWETMVDNLDFNNGEKEPFPGLGKIKTTDDATKKNLSLSGSAKVLHKIQFATRHAMWHDILTAIIEYGFDPLFDTHYGDAKKNIVVRAYQQ